MTDRRLRTRLDIRWQPFRPTSPPAPRRFWRRVLQALDRAVDAHVRVHGTAPAAVTIQLNDECRVTGAIAHEQ